MSDAADEPAERHGFGPDAVDAARRALRAGGGRMAQFDHPELGGYGQWSGGMTMIGRMGDRELKERVGRLFSDLARGDEAPASGSSGSGPEPLAGPEDWWPSDLGRPSATGSQNGSRYAVFAERRRLAVWRDGAIALYDTGEHRVGGVGQAGEGALPTVSGPDGPIPLDRLRRLT